MIGTWTLRNADERAELAYLIANMPIDGRYEIIIRKVWHPTPTDSSGQPYQTREERHD